jgi:hypothetical protein
MLLALLVARLNKAGAVSWRGKNCGTDGIGVVLPTLASTMGTVRHGIGVRPRVS